MMNDDSCFSLKDFLLANPGKKLWELDYIHAIYKFGNVPNDLIICMLEVFNPLLKSVDNRIYIDKQFSQDKYNEYKNNGKTDAEIQFWLNLIEVTGIFNDISTTDALKVADSLAEIWNCKIQTDMKSFNGKARAIYDEETKEVFVTID